MKVARLVRYFARVPVVSSLVLLVLLVLPSAVRADVLYIPFATPLEGSAGAARVRIWASNPSPLPRRVSVALAATSPAGLAGQVRLPIGGQFTIAPEATATATVPIGAGLATAGFLELSGAPQLHYSAWLEIVDGQGRVTGRAHLPVVGSARLAEPAETVAIQPLERTPGAIASSFGLLNPAAEPTACSVAFFRADGSRIAPSVELAVAAGTLRYFADALALVGTPTIRDARFEVTCQGPAFAFGVLEYTDRGEMLVATPARAGSSALEPPL